MSEAVSLSISIVSHAQGPLIRPLLEQLAAWPTASIEILLTLNLPEDESFVQAAGPIPVRVIRNLAPRGFGANHNRAFEVANGEFFLVLNPDIRLTEFSFAPLFESVRNAKAGVVGPAILDTTHQPTDSPRRFPTLLRLARRVLTRTKTPDYGHIAASTPVEWVGGMFMLFRRELYRELGGFDERFFMYMEDVDICRRIRDRGLQVVFDPAVAVIHDARRQNRRSAKHLRWHVTSLLRYLLLYRASRRWPV
jgi:GT2 family glycosyltransferase